MGLTSIGETTSWDHDGKIRLGTTITTRTMTKDDDDRDMDPALENDRPPFESAWRRADRSTCYTHHRWTVVRNITIADGGFEGGGIASCTGGGGLKTIFRGMRYASTSVHP